MDSKPPQPSASNPPPKPWERAGGSSGSAPFRPPSAGNTSDVVEASGTAKPGEIVSSSDRTAAVNRNSLGRPVPTRPWEQNYGNNSYGGGAYGSTMNNSLYGSGMYGSSSYGGGMYGGGMYGNSSMYRSGGYGGGLYGSSGMYGNSGMYGGGMYNSGFGGPMGGYGMGMGGPYGGQDPNDPYGPPSSPPGFWMSFLRVMHGVVNFFGRISILIDQNTQAFHMFMTALLQPLFESHTKTFYKMKNYQSALVAVAALVEYASGHAFFQQAGKGSTDYGTTCVRMPPNNSPVTDVSSPSLACNVGGSKGVASTCEASAGDSFFVEMHSQPNDRSCSAQAIGGNHFGPVMIYMAKVEDATSADPAGLSWFKVSEEGYDAATKKWGTDSLNANCGKREFKIPSKIPAGDYLVRAEAIALHAAGQVGGAQFYMSCYQVKIASSGGGQLPAGVKIPGAYSATDPGIKVDIYGSGFKEYTIPGPKVIDQTFF